MPHHVADIDEVSGLLTVAVQYQCFAASRPFREDRDHPGIGRVRILAWTEDIEEAQPEGGDAMHGPCYLRMQLRTELVRPIRRSWPSRCGLCDGQHLAIAID